MGKYSKEEGYLSVGTQENVLHLSRSQELGVAPPNMIPFCVSVLSK